MGEARIFHGRPARKTGSEATPYVIQFPPPNVTGTLHMGHAFNQTIMDGLVRYHRMSGNDTVFIPGTDHAGIATQIVVERQLDAQRFRATTWAARSSSKKSGNGRKSPAARSPDRSAAWARPPTGRASTSPWTSASRGVVETFVRLHKQGLIYRGKRLVNWDPKLLTAVSDLEVVSEETDGHMWHILYPFVDGPQTITDKDGQSVTLRGLTIATTRPETMLADGALCVHPEDPRYKHLVGSWSSCCATATSPSSPTISSTPNSAPAASRSLARTTSTTTPARCATICP